MSIETKTERDINLVTGEPVVRLFYRREGERRWNRKLVFTDDGTTVEDIEAVADEIAAYLLGSPEGDGPDA